MIVTQSPTSMPLTPTGTPLQMVISICLCYIVILFIWGASNFHCLLCLTKAKDTLPPTPVPTDDYLSRISLHQPGVTCVCSANDVRPEADFYFCWPITSLSGFLARYHWSTFSAVAIWNTHNCLSNNSCPNPSIARSFIGASILHWPAYNNICSTKVTH